MIVQAFMNAEEVFALQLRNAGATKIVVILKLVKSMHYHLDKENVWTYVKDQWFAEETPFVDLASIDRSAHVLKDTLATPWTKKLDV